MSYSLSQLKTAGQSAFPKTGGTLTGNLSVTGNLNFTGSLTKNGVAISGNPSFPLKSTTDGDATAPAYAFTSETNTGWYKTQNSLKVAVRSVDIAEFGPFSTTTSLEYPVVSLVNAVPFKDVTGQAYGNGRYYVRASSTITSNFYAFMAFDKDIYTDWRSSASYASTNYLGSTSTNGYLGEWVEIQLPSAIYLKSYYVTGYLSQWRLFGSNDGTNWTVLHTASYPTNVTPDSTITTNISTMYTYFRIAINRTSDGTTICTVQTLKLNAVEIAPCLTIPANGYLSIGAGSAPTYTLQLGSDSAAKPSTNTWTVASDERLKENIEKADLDRCYEIVKQLPLKRYTWKTDVYSEEQVKDRTKIGWIAQDVEAFFPKAVRKSEAFGLADCRGLDADQIYAVMYGAVQKLQTMVEALEEPNVNNL